MQVVVKLSVYEGEVMHNICRGGLGGRIFCRVCQFVPFACSLGVLWVAITRNVNICVWKIPGISMLESSCRDTASLRFTDTRQVIGARLDVGVCLCGSAGGLGGTPEPSQT